MKARILFWLGCVVLGGCKNRRSRPTNARIPRRHRRPDRSIWRVAWRSQPRKASTGLKAGMELKVIETRPEGFLVEAESMRFEIDARDTTRDRDLAETLLAREQPGEPTRQSAITEHWQIEDRKFLAEENIRRSAEEAHSRAGQSAKSALDDLERACLIDVAAVAPLSKIVPAMGRCLCGPLQKSHPRPRAHPGAPWRGDDRDNCVMLFCKRWFAVQKVCVGSSYLYIPTGDVA